MKREEATGLSSCKSASFLKLIAVAFNILFRNIKLEILLCSSSSLASNPHPGNSETWPLSQQWKDYRIKWNCGEGKTHQGLFQILSPAILRKQSF